MPRQIGLNKIIRYKPNNRLQKDTLQSQKITSLHNRNKNKTNLE